MRRILFRRGHFLVGGFLLIALEKVEQLCLLFQFRKLRIQPGQVGGGAIAALLEITDVVLTLEGQHLLLVLAQFGLHARDFILDRTRRIVALLRAHIAPRGDVFVHHGVEKFARVNRLAAGGLQNEDGGLRDRRHREFHGGNHHLRRRRTHEVFRALPHGFILHQFALSRDEKVHLFGVGRALGQIDFPADHHAPGGFIDDLLMRGLPRAHGEAHAGGGRAPATSICASSARGTEARAWCGPGTTRIRDRSRAREPGQEWDP